MIFCLCFPQLPTFKHGDNIVNESYAACLYLEVRNHYTIIIAAVILCIYILKHKNVQNVFRWQTQFKSQGYQLIPDSSAEMALMYQRMFEGLTFYEKLSETLYILLFERTLKWCYVILLPQLNLLQLSGFGGYRWL